MNLLTRWHKNTIITGVEPESGLGNKNGYEYVLDQPLVCKEGETDMDDFLLEVNERGYYTV